MLDAAESLLAGGGFDGLSVRHVADAVGASRQVVYTHFGGMDGLLDALHRRLSERLAEAVDAVDAPPGTTRHVLEAAAVYRRVARTHPELYQLVFEQPVAEYVAGDVATADGRRSFGTIVALAEAWLRTTRSIAKPSGEESMALARALWSSTHGFVVLERVGFATPDDTDELSERALASMLAGWTT